MLPSLCSQNLRLSYKHNTPSAKMKLQFFFTVLLAASAPMLAVAIDGLRALANFEGSTSTNKNNNVESHEDEADIMWHEHLRALHIFMSMETPAPTSSSKGPPTRAPTGGMMSGGMMGGGMMVSTKSPTRAPPTGGGMMGGGMMGGGMMGGGMMGSSPKKSPAHAPTGGMMGGMSGSTK